MRYLRLLPILFILLPLFHMASASQTDIRVLPNVIPAHPRLLANELDWHRVREQVETDGISRKIFMAMQANAEKVLEAEPVERVVTGRRLLSVSRTALQRIMLLGALYQITDEGRYAQRAKEELLAVAAFTDWNPSHFLDTAEMALAVSVGYDWIYDFLDAETRQVLQDALMEKAISPSEEFDYWLNFTNNWNQVCHAGISAAAIALADIHPQLTDSVLRRAVEKVPLAGAAYAPDGAFPEGPMYWSYATQFHLVLVQALETFSGDDFGLGSLPGMERTGGYIHHMTAPSGNYFNYGDCRIDRPFHVPMFWLAARFDHTEWLEYDITNIDAYLADYVENSSQRLMPLALIWRRPGSMDTGSQSSEVEAVHYRGDTPLAVFRVGQGPRALYAGIKAGSPSVSHGQMDVGSFVLEADGVRWAVDLGLQEYHSIERLGMNLWGREQDSERWTIFRLSPESHNVPSFSNARQLVTGKSKITAFADNGDQSHAIIDLTPVYADEVASIRRGMRLVDGESVLLQDEWTSLDNQTASLTWQMMTAADRINILQDRIILEQDGQTMTLQVLDGVEFTARLEDTDNLIRPYDAPNPGVSRLSIITQPKESGRLRILFTPGSATEAPAPANEGLADW